jgi:hypothetical protein
MDQQHRYIDSWTPDAGVTSYGGFVNESFNDDEINCTIKWPPGRPTAGIYAKRDILLNAELLTGYGKPQWVYAIHFFSHLLSARTIEEATARYNITDADQLDPHLSSFITANSPLQPTQAAHPCGLPQPPSPNTSTISAPDPTTQPAVQHAN